MDRKNRKRIRSSNFSATERELLLDIVLDGYKDTIDSKKCDKETWASKERAWKEVVIHFNSRNTGTIRGMKSLKFCYENLKKRSKKAIAPDKVDVDNTRRSSFVRPTVTASDQKLIAALKPRFLPLGNPYDVDADFLPEITCDDLNNTESCNLFVTAANEEMVVTKEENIVENSESEPKGVYVELEAVQHTRQDAITGTTVSDLRPTNTKTETVIDLKCHFHKRKLECLEYEHKLKVQCMLDEHEIRMETLKVEKEIKELELIAKRRKLESQTDAL